MKILQSYVSCMGEERYHLLRDIVLVLFYNCVCGLLAVLSSTCKIELSAKGMLNILYDLYMEE